MKQNTYIEKTASNTYDKLLIEKKNNSHKNNMFGAEFLDLTTNKSGKGKKVVIFLVDSDVTISDFKNDKNLRSLC